MSFLSRVAGLSRRERARSSEILGEYRIMPLLLRIERSQLRLLGHLIRMAHSGPPLGVFRAHLTERRPRIDPELVGTLHVSPCFLGGRD